jgi:hypothetical protein
MKLFGLIRAQPEPNHDVIPAQAGNSAVGRPPMLERRAASRDFGPRRNGPARTESPDNFSPADCAIWNDIRRALEQGK